MFLKYKRIWSYSTLKSSNDLVIIGGGLHGLATAYYLARDHGKPNVQSSRSVTSVLPAGPAVTPLSCGQINVLRKTSGYMIEA